MPIQHAPKGTSQGGQFIGPGSQLSASQKALQQAVKGAGKGGGKGKAATRKGTGKGGGHKRRPTAIQGMPKGKRAKPDAAAAVRSARARAYPGQSAADWNANFNQAFNRAYRVQHARKALIQAQRAVRANPRDKAAKRHLIDAQRQLKRAIAAQRKQQKRDALIARKQARANATAAKKTARAQATAQKKAAAGTAKTQKAQQKATAAKMPKAPRGKAARPPALSPQAVAALRSQLVAKASSGSSSSSFNPSKHPRAQKGSATGGQFITAGQQTAPAKGAAKRIGAGAGPLTQQQITAYQQAHGLKVDGLIGQQTAAALLGQGAQAPGSIRQDQLQALAGQASGSSKPKSSKPKSSKPAGSSPKSSKAPVAKQMVAISDPGSGQTATIDANRLGMYRKLRRKGVPHKAAVAMCKRTKMAKAKYVPLHPPIVHHGKINWVDRVGGLPGPIDAIARVLISQGWDESRAVATAVSQAKKQCATGLAAGGHIHLGGEARATICAAVASWEAKKAAA